MSKIITLLALLMMSITANAGIGNLFKQKTLADYYHELETKNSEVRLETLLEESINISLDKLDSSVSDGQESFSIDKSTVVEMKINGAKAEDGSIAGFAMSENYICKFSLTKQISLFDANCEHKIKPELNERIFEHI